MIKPEITKPCSFCGDNFTSSKSTAKFCCNSCRTKANIKRRLDEQARAEQEAIHQQEMELLKRKADSRRLKREQLAETKRQEQEEQAAKVQRDFEAKKIQDEIDAFETTTKNRQINSIVEMLHANAETKEKQLLADKERKINDDRIRSENEMKKAKERLKNIEKGLAELIKNHFNQNNNTGNTSIKPGPITTPSLPPKPGMPSQLKQTTPPAPSANPVRKPIIDDILDQLNIF